MSDKMNGNANNTEYCVTESYTNFSLQSSNKGKDMADLFIERRKEQVKNNTRKSENVQENQKEGDK